MLKTRTNRYVYFAGLVAELAILVYALVMSDWVILVATSAVTLLYLFLPRMYPNGMGRESTTREPESPLPRVVRRRIAISIFAMFGTFLLLASLSFVLPALTIDYLAIIVGIALIGVMSYYIFIFVRWTERQSTPDNP